jgi:hypothetical protein
MNDSELADVIITRLNNLITDPAVRKDISALIEARIPCSQETLDHPTIQAGWPTKEAYENKEPGKLGVLGLLNGLIGTIPDEGPKQGWGYVTADFDDNMQLTGFKKTQVA